ncbi:hypothetical protein ACFS07_07060 [Undibacterium arcticum]
MARAIGFTQLEQRFDFGRRSLRQLRQTAHNLQPQRRWRHRLQQRLGVELRPGTVFRTAQIIVGGHFIEQKLR